jgi:hypothetical protein
MDSKKKKKKSFSEGERALGEGKCGKFFSRGKRRESGRNNLFFSTQLKYKKYFLSLLHSYGMLMAFAFDKRTHI